MQFKKAILAAAGAAALSVTAGSGIAAADHSHVDNPSGCHETNFNGGTPNERSGQDPAESGWHNSAGGHDRAVEAGAHESGGCD